jgi:hypothetical protein
LANEQEWATTIQSDVPTQYKNFDEDVARVQKLFPAATPTDVRQFVAKAWESHRAKRYGDEVYPMIKAAFQTLNAIYPDATAFQMRNMVADTIRNFEWR